MEIHPPRKLALMLPPFSRFCEGAPTTFDHDFRVKLYNQFLALVEALYVRTCSKARMPTCGAPKVHTGTTREFTLGFEVGGMDRFDLRTSIEELEPHIERMATQWAELAGPLLRNPLFRRVNFDSTDGWEDPYSLGVVTVTWAVEDYSLCPPLSAEDMEHAARVNEFYKTHDLSTPLNAVA